MENTLKKGYHSLIGYYPNADDFKDICCGPLETITLFGEVYKTGCLIIPDDISNIESGALQDCGLFHKIIIPARVRHIGTRAFCGARFLKELVFQGDVQNIRFESDAFEGCPVTKISLQTLGANETDPVAALSKISALYFSQCFMLKCYEALGRIIDVQSLQVYNYSLLFNQSICYKSFGLTLSYVHGKSGNESSFKSESGRLNLDSSYELKRELGKATGIGCCLGNNNIRAIDVDDAGSCDYLISKMLYELGLPSDYPWVVYSGSRKGFHIIFKAPNINEYFESKAYAPNDKQCSFNFNGFDEYFPPFNRMELRWMDHLVLPPSLHYSGNRYIFRGGHSPDQPVAEISISRINQMIDHFCGSIIFKRFHYDNISFELAVPEKIYSVFHSRGGWRESLTVVDDSIAWLEECTTPAAYVKLAIKYLTKKECSASEKGKAIELLAKAGDYPVAHFNIASLIACKYCMGTCDEVEKHLVSLPSSWDEHIKLVRENASRFLSETPSSNDMLFNKKTTPAQKERGEYVFFDTETTGLPIRYDEPPSNTDNWPRLVQLAWIVSDREGTVIAKHSHIIKPVGFTVPTNSSRYHGITQEYASQNGEDLESVLNLFLSDVKNATYLVGHNIQFDQNVVESELIRNHCGQTILDKKTICTMEGSVYYCDLPDYKFPTLRELYSKLFNTFYVNAHNASADVEATMKCFWELRKRDVL